MKMTMTRFLARALVLTLLVGALSSCSSTRKKIKAIISVKNSLVKIAEGDSDAVYPMVATAVNTFQDWVVVSADKPVIIVEIHKIPGTEVKLPKTGDSRYYLRINLEDLGGTTKVTMKFFKGSPGKDLAKGIIDSVIRKYVGIFFEGLVEQLLKSGCIFKL